MRLTFRFNSDPNCFGVVTGQNGYDNYPNPGTQLRVISNQLATNGSPNKQYGATSAYMEIANTVGRDRQGNFFPESQMKHRWTWGSYDLANAGTIDVTSEGPNPVKTSLQSVTTGTTTTQVVVEEFPYVPAPVSLNPDSGEYDLTVPDNHWEWILFHYDTATIV